MKNKWFLGLGKHALIFFAVAGIAVFLPACGKADTVETKRRPGRTAQMQPVRRKMPHRRLTGVKAVSRRIYLNRLTQRTVTWKFHQKMSMRRRR